MLSKLTNYISNIKAYWVFDNKNKISTHKLINGGLILNTRYIFNNHNPNDIMIIISKLEK